jgi:hypothetical protein
MSTTNTDYSYYWYIRKKGKNYYLGVVDDNGDAIGTADLDIQIFYDEFHDEISSTQDTLDIPIQFELAFVKGCANEILQMQGQYNQVYEKAFKEMIYKAIEYQNNQANSPKIIKPYDMREDTSKREARYDPT